jgi:hypothetical protein
MKKLLAIVLVWAVVLSGTGFAFKHFIIDYEGGPKSNPTSPSATGQTAKTNPMRPSTPTQASTPTLPSKSQPPPQPQYELVEATSEPAMIVEFTTKHPDTLSDDAKEILDKLIERIKNTWLIVKPMPPADSSEARVVTLRRILKNP